MYIYLYNCLVILFKNLRRKLEHNAEDDDEEGLKKKMALMKTQADHRMAVLQGNRLNMDDAMDDVCLTGGVVLRGGSHHFTYDSPSAIYNIQLLPSYEVNIESCQP